MSRSLTDVPSLTASATDSAECASGIPNLRMMISVSTPGRVDVAEHLGHAADRPARRRGPLGQLDHHHVARGCSALLARRNDNVHQDAAVKGRHVSHALAPRLGSSRRVALVAPHNPLVGALEYSDDAAFGAASVFDAFDAGDDAVAVHRLVEMRAGHVDVAARVKRTLGDDEAVAAGMRLQTADVQVHLLGQTEAVSTNLNEIAGGDERFEMAFERRAIFAGNLENLKELAHAGRVMHPVAHQRENLITGEHMRLQYYRIAGSSRSSVRLQPDVRVSRTRRGPRKAGPYVRLAAAPKHPSTTHPAQHPGTQHEVPSTRYPLSEQSVRELRIRPG